MSKRRLNILLGAIALILGCLLYILFRSNTYIAKYFRDFKIFIHVRKFLFPYCCDFLKFYFPDFLWGFSLCCGLQAIHNPGNRGVVLCGCITFLCGFIWEALQYLGVINGTGDILDISMYLFASLINIIMNLEERKK